MLLQNTSAAIFAPTLLNGQLSLPCPSAAAITTAESDRLSTRQLSWHSVPFLI